MRLFVSYSHRDRQITRELEALLTSAGHEVWIDNNLVTGKAWQQQLSDEIKKADAIILTLTPNWTASPYCQWEYMTAIEANRKVIPVMLVQVELPDYIGKIQYADMTGGFDDSARTQKLLGDLHQLSTEIPTEKLAVLDKTDLEARALQSIHTGDITNATVSANQTTSARLTGTTTDKFSQQQIALGNISGSNISLNQSNIENQTNIFQKTWTLPVVVSLLLIAIIAIGTVLSNQEALGQLLIPILGEPPPQRMEAGFNVVLAGFGSKGEGEIVSSTAADDIADVIYQSLQVLLENDDIDHLMGWRDAGVGHILNEDADERREHAAQIAGELNADIVIYGIVEESTYYLSFTPEFFIAPGFVEAEPDLFLSANLTQPIEILRDSDDITTSAADNLRERVQITQAVIAGIGRYIYGDFAASQEIFQQAIDQAPDTLVLYVYAGNAALREPDYKAALTYFDDAIDRDPGFSRALLGRSIALRGIAAENDGRSPPPYDPELQPEEEIRCTSDITDMESQILLEVALQCIADAEQDPDPSDYADIDIKAAFERGYIQLMLSNRGADLWEDADESLAEAIELYEASDATRQLRIRDLIGHAWARRGEIVLETQDYSKEIVSQAREYYQAGLELLQEDINRAYNASWVAEGKNFGFYQQQIDALDMWLDMNTDSDQDATDIQK